MMCCKKKISRSRKLRSDISRFKSKLSMFIIVKYHISNNIITIFKKVRFIKMLDFLIFIE